MTKVNLPSSLASALKQAEDLESRIDRTKAALVTADARAERAKANRLEAELERDRLAGERDLAAASESLGEAPTTDAAEIKKAMASADKRLAAERSEAETALAAQRGLRLRLEREQAERPQHLEAIEAAMGAARLEFERVAILVFDKVEQILLRELGPIVQAETAVNGDRAASWLREIRLESAPHQPYRTLRLKDAIASLPVPADFQALATICRRLRDATTVEPDAQSDLANDRQAA